MAVHSSLSTRPPHLSNLTLFHISMFFPPFFSWQMYEQLGGLRFSLILFSNFCQIIWWKRINYKQALLLYIPFNIQRFEDKFSSHFFFLPPNYCLKGNNDSLIFLYTFWVIFKLKCLNNTTFKANKGQFIQNTPNSQAFFKDIIRNKTYKIRNTTYHIYLLSNICLNTWKCTFPPYPTFFSPKQIFFFLVCLF